MPPDVVSHTSPNLRVSVPPCVTSSNVSLSSALNTASASSAIFSNPFAIRSTAPSSFSSRATIDRWTGSGGRMTGTSANFFLFSVFPNTFSSFEANSSQSKYVKYQTRYLLSILLPYKSCNGSAAIASLVHSLRPAIAARPSVNLKLNNNVPSATRKMLFSLTASCVINSLLLKTMPLSKCDKSAIDNHVQPSSHS